MPDVEVVVAHAERATLRVGDVFLKVIGDPALADRELEAMRLAPIACPEILWHRPPVLALAALPGTALGRLGTPSPASDDAWAAAGAVVRALHDAPLPPWPTPADDDLAARLDDHCAWLIEHDVVAADVVRHNREVAEVVLTPYEPVFTHGDLQLAHVFTDGDEVTGVLDWSEAGPGDAHYDLAVLTLGQEDRLDAVLAGYGDRAASVDLDRIRGWWSARSLMAIRWLVEHGYDPTASGCEVDVLLARM